MPPKAARAKNKTVGRRAFGKSTPNIRRGFPFQPPERNARENYFEKSPKQSPPARQKMLAYSPPKKLTVPI
ncbi:MAG: hypothetical protein BHW65_01305 [Verrucomicrobia bacterium CAG:312_58_20]|nr:MAG: hypothetical protein BHW65_01305 [Verrucomicrobia bacterium CAG:312_58_20]PWL68859.1 MAG: hypothetical protein DBY30_02230 [Verrucomicrobiota bacterium]